MALTAEQELRAALVRVHEEVTAALARIEQNLLEIREINGRLADGSVAAEARAKTLDWARQHPGMIERLRGFLRVAE